MNIDGLVARFPRLWHATHPGGWEGISSTGLRTATDLLASGGRAEEAGALRAEAVSLTTPDGTATLREQTCNRPDPAPYLDAMTVPEWWTLLNSRSYYFVDREALDRMVEASLERGIAQEIITFETRRLLAPVADHVEVTTINASVFPRATGPARGRGTFQPLADYAGLVTKIKEVTITVPVQVADASVVSVVSQAPGLDPVRIFPRVRARA